MKAKLRRQLDKRKHKVRRRIDKANWDGTSPMLGPPSIQYELSEKQHAIAAGGIGLIMQLTKQLRFRQAINRAIPLLKWHLPYDEADHVLNIALNLLAGGSCLEHLELRRNDEAYLDALGAQRIPDPTTAGDFCRRFSRWDIFMLTEAFNQLRAKVWKQQPNDFFDEAVIEADGTMVETLGQCKQGIGMNYKKQWGYHPLIVTLANTGEPLYVANRSGNRPSHENAPIYFDRAISVCREAGFRKILLRGDTDFALTKHFDRWSDAGVGFVFGFDAMLKLEEIADALENTAWKPLRRKGKSAPKTGRRRKPRKYKQEVVIENEYQNKRLQREWIAEFAYQPGACARTYRVAVVRKEIEVTAGQRKLFDDSPYLFYISNRSKSEASARQIVFSANQRCDQENTISQLKSMGALSAPLDNLNSNWAYMVIASLAWTLKCWAALLPQERGTQQQKTKHRATKRRIMRMDFSTFRQKFMMIPAQIIRRARSTIYRFLAWSESLQDLMLIHSQLNRPLRC